MEKGNFLSETTYYTISKVGKDSVEAKTSTGQNIKLSLKYVDQLCDSAHKFNKTTAVTQTEMINILLNNSRIAMSVLYRKADKKKTKKALNLEKLTKIEEIQLAPASKVTSLLQDLMDNPILDHTPGEMRLIVGYHNGKVDERGRVPFIDAEDNNILKSVDPRTIEYVIVNNIKYTLKNK